MNTLNAATDRFFRFYAKHAIAPDEDTLFALLNALHSFNDKLRATNKINLFESANFVALKALRNLFHHEAELLHEVRIIPVNDLPPLVTDMAIVCLVEHSLVERAARSDKKVDPEQVMRAFKWYGSVANIQPNIFNVAVDVFEVVQPLKLSLSSDAYQDFVASYQVEEEQDHSHRVNGDISCHASDVNEVLLRVFRQGGRTERRYGRGKRASRTHVYTDQGS